MHTFVCLLKICVSAKNVLQTDSYIVYYILEKQAIEYTARKELSNRGGGIKGGIKRVNPPRQGQIFLADGRSIVFPLT